MVDQLAYPDRTPGILGNKDAGDPTRWALLGDTPGPLGVNDCGAPVQYLLSGMNTFHDWALEQQFHLPVNDQLASFFPAGKKEEVLTQATTFLTESERIREDPYVPAHEDGTVIGVSGVTIGIGYDLGQHTEKQIRQEWAELDARSPRTKPSPLDLLAAAAGLSKEQAKKYLPQVKHLTVSRDIARKVFRETMLPEYYDRAVRFFPGLTELPTGAQVALLSLVFNTGTLHKKEGPVLVEAGRTISAMRPSSSASLHLNFHSQANGTKISLGCSSRLTSGFDRLHGGTLKTEEAEAPATLEVHEEDFFGNDWEKRQLREAVRSKDLVWVYWYFESSRRIWAEEKSLVKRRNDEAGLIFPYVQADLQREAFLRRFQHL